MPVAGPWVACPSQAQKTDRMAAATPSQLRPGAPWDTQGSLSTQTQQAGRLATVWSQECRRLPATQPQRDRDGVRALEPELSSCLPGESLLTSDFRRAKGPGSKNAAARDTETRHWEPEIMPFCICRVKQFWGEKRHIR